MFSLLYVYLLLLTLCSTHDPSDPKNIDKRSCLDLVIVSLELETYIDSIVIDSGMKLAPFRPLSKNLSKQSDHFPLIVTFVENFTCIKEKKVVKSNHTIWNTNREGGWKIYQEMTDNAEPFEKIFDEVEITDTTKAMKNVKKALDKIRYTAV